MIKIGEVVDATLAALLGICTAVVAAASTVIVAVINNKRERTTSAETAMEETLRERILLRDEQIAARDHKIEQLEETLRLCREGRLHEPP